MSAWAQARHVDSPGSGPSLLFVELGPPVHHVCPPVAFICVDEVVARLLHLGYVHVGSQAEHVGVPEDQDPHHEVGQAEGMVGCPWLGERLPEILRRWNSCWLQRSFGLRQTR